MVKHTTHFSTYGVRRLIAAGFIATGFTGLALAQQPTPIDEVSMYAFDRSNSSILRFEFESNSFSSVGQVRTSDNILVEDLGAFTYIPGRLHFLGVWNHAPGESRLMRVNLFDGQADPMPEEVGYGEISAMTVVSDLQRGPGPNSPTKIVLKDSTNTDAYEIEFIDVEYHPDGTSAWRYYVRSLPGGNRDLSNWSLQLDPDAHDHVLPGTSPSNYDLGWNPHSGGSWWAIKWDVGNHFSEGEFVIVLDKHYAGSVDGTGVGVQAKGGNKSDFGELFGPTGDVPEEHTIYAISNPDPSTSHLITIDPKTGKGTHSMTLERRYDGLTTDHNGRLFASHDKEVYRIDPFTNEEIFIGDHNFRDILALDWVRGDESHAIEIPGVPPSLTENGALFGFSVTDKGLILIDPETGGAIKYNTALNNHNLGGMVLATYRRDPVRAMASAMHD